MSVICTCINDTPLLMRRDSPTGKTITDDEYKKLFELYDKDTESLPDWLVEKLASMGIEASIGDSVRKWIYCRDRTNKRYIKASYEITHGCNYDCRHCFLRGSTHLPLDLANRFSILDSIENSGCIWLQITGGEPLSDRYFAKTYEYAYGLGMLINISTNGSLLGSANSEILTQCRPYKVTVSSYGATKEIYEEFTRSPGSFTRFMYGLNWLASHAIRAKINIIVTKDNEHELTDMKAVARDFGFKFRVYGKLHPTVCDDTSPMDLMSKSRQANSTSKGYTGCMAGKTFFHVNPSGHASICIPARNSTVDILKYPESFTSYLSEIGDKETKRPDECLNCSFASVCPTCPINLASYARTSKFPAYICRKDRRKL